MKTTEINVEKLLEAGNNAKSAAAAVKTVKTNIETVKKGLASDILSRDGNRMKIDEIIRALDAAAARITSIRNTVDNSANAYYNVDAGVQRRSAQIESVGRKLTSGRNEEAFKKG